MLTKLFRCDTILWLTHVNFTKSKCVCDAAVVTAAAFHNRIFFRKLSPLKPNYGVRLKNKPFTKYPKS